MNNFSQNIYNNFIRIRGIRFLYHNLIQPRSLGETHRHKEFILNVVLVGTLIMGSFLLISIILSHVLPPDSYSGINPVLFIGILSFFGFLLFLSRKGLVTLSSYILIGTYSMSTLYGIYHWSFMVPMIILGVITTIIISSILISTRFGFLLTLLMSFLICGITYFQIHGVIPLSLSWKNDPLVFQDILEVCSLLFIVSSIAWLSNRTTESSLERVIQSEQALRDERDMLEVRVEERTRILKEIQHQELARLEYFADFGKISSSIFHDLMNPLTHMMIHFDQISEETTCLAETREHLTKIVSASKRMGTFIGTVRKHLHQSTSSEIFSPYDEITDAITLLGHTLRASQVETQITGDTNNILTGSSFRFHQVMLNLISNACDAYQTVPHELHERIITITYHLESNSDLWCLEVTDHGCGIDTLIQDKIYDPFFSTKTAGGTGIGLFHVKNIIEKEFLGTISFTSTLHQGTTFSIKIPYNKK